MKKLVRVAIAATVVPVGFWFAGYNFNDRGIAAFYCYALTCLSVWFATI